MFSLSVLVVAVAADSRCPTTIQQEWAAAGLDAPCMVLDGSPEQRVAAAKTKWKLTDEQAACAVATSDQSYSGDEKQWRVCVDRWPEQTIFWAGLLSAEYREANIPFEKLTAVTAGKLYALHSRHSLRLAELVLSAKPKELASVLQAVDQFTAFAVAWSAFSRRKDFSDVEWPLVVRAILVNALERNGWFIFASDVWLQLPAPVRSKLVSSPLWSEGDEERRVDLRAVLAFALLVADQPEEAKRIPAAVRRDHDRLDFFVQVVEARRKGVPVDPWELAVGLAEHDDGDEALVLAFAPTGRGNARAIGPYLEIIRERVSLAVLRNSPRMVVSDLVATAVNGAHTRVIERLAAMSGLADGGVPFHPDALAQVEAQRKIMAAAEKGQEAFQAALQEFSEGRLDGGLPELPTMRSPYVERAKAWRGAAGVPAEFDRSGFSIVRAEKLPDGVVALATSQRFDPTGEVSPGGYWLIVSNGRGTREVYLGLSQDRPYRAHAKSAVPLLRDGVVRLDVRQAPIDEKTITFPPVAVKRKVEREHVILEAKLSALEADADGDGLSDLSEVRLLLDPKNRDTDGDGVGDGDDLLPRADDRVPAGPRTELWGALLEYFGVAKGGTAFVPDDDSPIGTAVPHDIDRTTFIIAQKGQFGGVRTLTRIITLTPLERRAAGRVFGSFYPLELEVYVSEDGQHAYVKWSDNPSGGSARADLREGKWEITMLTQWIT